MLEVNQKLLRTTKILQKLKLLRRYFDAYLINFL